MALWLYLHFPSLQLDTIYLSEATDQSGAAINTDQAVIVIDGRANSVVQINQAAQKSGIKIGMGLGTASALQRDIRVVDYRPELEVERLQGIAQTLYSITSDIALFEPNGLLLRVSTMLSLYQSLDSYWSVVCKQLQVWQLNYRYATGYSPLSARILARTGKNCISEDAQFLRNQMSQCPLSATELEDKTSEKLARVGISHVGELLQIPLPELSRRFDIDLVNYIGRLRGELQHPQPFYHPPQQFRRYLELLYEIEKIELLQHPLKRLFAQLEQFLLIRNQVTQRVELIFHQRDEQRCSIEVASAQGEYRSVSWLKLLGLRLERLELEAPVIAITLNVSAAEARHSDAIDLFDGEQGSMTSAQLISLLQARLGEERIRGLSLVDDFRPEKATKLCNPHSSNSHNSWPPSSAIRPSMLLPEPRMLKELVSLAVGPERVVTGWWDSKGVCRDYFIARNHFGQWLWVFRTLENKWFLHGYFC